MPKDKGVDLSLMAPEMKKAIQDMTYGEAASSDDDTTKMVIQSALSRYLSGKKEFSKGPTMQDVVKKGYYAVSKNSPLYKEATSGKFANPGAKARHAAIGKQLDSILGDKDYSTDHAQFYFTPDEETKLKAGKIDKNTGKKVYDFDFSKVKSKGTRGIYNTYSY